MAIPLRLRHASLSLSLILSSVILAMGSAAAETPDHDMGMNALNSMSVDELETLRGREGINLINVQSLQDLKATASDNAINAGSVVSGPITIESNSLDGFSGVGLFNIMTGNNNAVGTAVGISVYVSQ